MDCPTCAPLSRSRCPPASSPFLVVFLGFDGVLRNIGCSPWTPIALLKISGWECVYWHSRAHDFLRRLIPNEQNLWHLSDSRSLSCALLAGSPCHRRRTPGD